MSFQVILITEGSNIRQGYRGYVTSRPFMGERAPQHVQNLVIRDYAERNGLAYKLSATEYAMPGCNMMLQQVIGELPSLQGMICYSLFQLPQRRDLRRHVFQKFLETSSELHAAVEQMVIRTYDDLAHVEDIWRIRLSLEFCPSVGNIKKYLPRKNFTGLQ